MTRMNRRTLLGGTLAVLAAPGLVGCSTVTRSTDVAAINAPVALPTYRRFAGPAPDLPTVDPRMPDAYRTFPAERPVVLGGRTPGDGTPFTGSTRTVSPIPPTQDRNAYWQELNARLGSRVDVTITPDADYASKFATSVAGDVLGDVFNVDVDFPYLPQFLEARAHDLTEFLSGDAILDYPFLANIPTESWRSCVYSGGIYAVPVPRGVLNTEQLFCRADLFAERGVGTDFGSVDDLIGMARELTDVPANRWAFCQVPDIVLSRMLGLPNTWALDGPRFVYYRELDGFKDVLDIGARLIREGLVHPDSVSVSRADLKLWFNEGSGLMAQDTFPGLNAYYQQNVAGDSYEIALPVVPGPDGGPGPLWVGPSNHSITALDKASPERIRTMLSLLNWLATPFGSEEYLFRRYGTEGRHFAFEGGQPVQNDLGASETALSAFPTQYLVDCPMPIYYAGHPEATDMVYDNLVASMPAAVTNATSGLYSPTKSIKGKSLYKALDDTRNQIFLGRLPVSAWDEAIADWRRGGGDQMRAEYEQALAARGQEA
ncbi:hypothetical protein [Pseudonocardia sp. HH130630-07]|uniref:hypothetical protein n=1 Tax=Pseudonocardia sp. HH130630-07 TaxID=1690815 RepID=UPI000814EA02|nr:hypothetical protein [Pseudonocardia sp. HH130630-07]ANY05115.1 hypothetical protein AFB00_00890 [Pseudonocardia sp. HH130630-07]